MAMNHSSAAMNAPNDSAALIAASIQRTVADAVDRNLIDSVRDGHWPQGLWRVPADAGFTRVLDADGPAPDWRDAAMASAATPVLDQSVLYANDRTQFGRPIGKFQAVQTLLAEVGTETAAGTMAVAAACANAGRPGDWFDIAVAKVRAGQMATRVTRHAHQVHGAIGLTQEHSLHHGTRRLWAWRSEYGRAADWALLLGEAALGVGEDALWARLMVEGGAVVDGG